MLSISLSNNIQHRETQGKAKDYNSRNKHDSHVFHLYELIVQSHLDLLGSNPVIQGIYSQIYIG